MENQLKPITEEDAKLAKKLTTKLMQVIVDFIEEKENNDIEGRVVTYILTSSSVFSAAVLDLCFDYQDNERDDEIIEYYTKSISYTFKKERNKEGYQR